MEKVKHPGIIIKDEMDKMKMNQNEFSIRTTIPTRTLTKLFDGEINLTTDIAKKLAMFFNKPIENVMNLQTKYDEYLIDKEILKNIDNEFEIVKMFDNNYIKEISNIKPIANNKVEVVERLRNLFMVNSLEILKDVNLLGLNKIFKEREFSEKEIVLHNAFISYAMYLSRFQKSFSFDYKNNTAMIEELKKITFEPKNQLYSLMEKLNKYGVKLILVPYSKELKITSFVKLSPEDNSVVLAVSTDSLDAYDVWFRVHAEIAYTYKLHTRLLSITYGDKYDDYTNKFAICTLMNPNAYDYFVSLHDFDSKALDIFCKKNNVAKFIIAGKLKKDKLVPKKALPKESITYKI